MTTMVSTTTQPARWGKVAFVATGVLGLVLLVWAAAVLSELGSHAWLVVAVVGGLGALAVPVTAALLRIARADARARKLAALVDVTNELYRSDELERIEQLVHEAATGLLTDADGVTVCVSDVATERDDVIARAGDDPIVEIRANRRGGRLRLDADERRMSQALVAAAAHAAGGVLRSRRTADQGRLASTVLAAISHDLRSPIATVIGSTHTLERHADELTPHRRDELLGAVRRSATRVDRMVNDLVALQRFELGIRCEPPSSSIAGVVSDLTADLESSTPIRILSDGPQDLRAAIEPAALTRVLDNLVCNAARQQPGAPVWLRWWQDTDGQVVVAVDDAGSGVAPEDRERVLQAFEQAGPDADRDHGVGLGLYITLRFVELAHGTLTIEDAPTGGASFQVRLPAPSA